MPLGLPHHVAARYATRSSASALHAAALLCLVLAVFEVLAYSMERPGLILWPALIALVPLFAALLLHDRRRTTFTAAMYLVIGGAALYWYAIVGTFELRVNGSTDAVVFSLPKLALVFVGAGGGARSMIGWAVGGWAVGEVAVAIAGLQAGARIMADATTLIPICAFIVVVLLVTVTRRVAMRTQPALLRARRDEQVSAERGRLGARAAAIMHDLALGHLAAVASAPIGPLPRSVREQMTDDIALLVGQEWLLDDTAVAESVDWGSSPLFEAISAAVDEGLQVDVTGDTSVVARLERSQAVAIGLAARQCLVNVLRHAEVDRAQIVLYGSTDAVSIMILDEGVGFDVDGTGADRLGLRHSVRRRIESVGGTVRVWSTPGYGTSVIIGMPISSDRAGVEP